MDKTRRVTNLTEIIQESQHYKKVVQPAPEQQEQPIKEQQLQTEQKPPDSQPENTTIPQNNAIAKTKKRKTDEREKKMYYLDPGQSDKLDDLRREYKQRTGIKLNEQDFMRRIINRLTIESLL